VVKLDSSRKRGKSHPIFIVLRPDDWSLGPDDLLTAAAYLASLKP